MTTKSEYALKLTMSAEQARLIAAYAEERRVTPEDFTLKAVMSYINVLVLDRQTRKRATTIGSAAGYAAE